MMQPNENELETPTAPVEFRDGRESRLLLARLELYIPSLSRVLIAAPRSNVRLDHVGAGLARAALAAQQPARLVHIREPGALVASKPGKSGQTDTNPYGLNEMRIGLAELRDAEGASRILSGFTGLTVVVGKGLIDDAASLLCVRSVECVVMVIRRGRSFRSDVSEAAEEVRRAGTPLAGAVLID